ncbi:MAG: flippase activity-associated protein Agl23 [Chthoniobacteraceae bacterium]
MRSDRWIPVAIVALALALRVTLLGIKPAHFDEGVNGWFVDQLTRTGFYHYDPTNFHGPLHFYVLFIAQTLLGRHEWALRLPLALVSTACVAMMLAFRPYFGKATCRIAALCMAVSPGFVFYGRYAIHESWFVFFLLLTSWGLAGLCHFGTRRHLWVAGAGVTGLILTKETYIIHAIALASGYGVLRWWERYSPSARFVPARQQWTNHDLVWMAAVCLGVIVLFYTGFLLDWSSLGGLVVSIFAWAHTGMGGQTGHEKEPWYWLRLMLSYEWPGMLGFIAAIGLAGRGTGRTLRWFALSGAAAFFAYSIVAYKTPWCLIAILWPFYFVFGAVVVCAAARFDRWVVGIVAALVIACSAAASLRLNFRDFANENEPYAYVQTTLDIRKLIEPLRALTARDRTNYHLPGYVVLGDVHPLPWLLADFTRVQIGNLTDLPKDVSDGQFFLVAEEYQEEIERTLRGSWYREKITLRGNSGQSQLLYLRPATFAEFVPGRQPEFTSGEPPAKVEDK